MRLILESELRIRVTAPHEAALEIESADPAIHFSPLHMLAASLVTCTVAVLVPWALQVGIGFADLEIAIDWEYVEDPYRVGRYDMTIRWPELPEERREAALRVAQHCTVEHTLRHPPAITAGFEAEVGPASGHAAFPR